MEWIAILFSRDLPDPRIRTCTSQGSMSPVSLALQAEFFPTSHQGSTFPSSYSGQADGVCRTRWDPHPVRWEAMVEAA